jgi:hypothetical protein
MWDRIRRQLVLAARDCYCQTIHRMNISPARNYCGNCTSYICASLIIFSLWISRVFPPLEKSSRSAVFSFLNCHFLLSKQIYSSKFSIQLVCSLLSTGKDFVLVFYPHCLNSVKRLLVSQSCIYYLHYITVFYFRFISYLFWIFGSFYISYITISYITYILVSTYTVLGNVNHLVVMHT